MGIIKSTYKKNRISIRRAVPWSFMVSRITSGITTIIFPYFIYHFFLEGNMNSDFSKYTNGSDYMTYIVLGASLNVLAVATLMNIGRALITELREGTLEPLLLSPASRSKYFVGCLLEQTSRALLEFVTVILVGMLLGARLTNLLSWESIFTIIISIFSFFSLGLLLSSIMLKTRDTYITQNTLFSIMNLVCGIVFPIQYLPLWVQKVSYLFPLTSAVQLFRYVVIGGEHIGQHVGLLIHVLLLSTLYGAIGIIWYKRIERTLIEKIFG